MTDRAMLTILSTLIDWECRADLYGTAALLVCANMALEHEVRGAPWSAFQITQKYAISKGRAQHTVWVSICYALKHSKGPKNPAEAMKAIVKRAYKNGTIDKM